MSWKCEKCGQKLKGREKFCPECAEKIVYKCKGCGKIMDDGKHRYCPVCNTERAEKRGDAIKKAGGTVAAVGSIAVAVVTRGKFGTRKS